MFTVGTNNGGCRQRWVPTSVGTNNGGYLLFTGLRVQAKVHKDFGNGCCRLQSIETTLWLVRYGRVCYGVGSFLASLSHQHRPPTPVVEPLWHFNESHLYLPFYLLNESLGHFIVDSSPNLALHPVLLTSFAPSSFTSVI